ncbi:MAG: hypothetical protein WAN36_11055 [Calditrichia bacterium]
MKVCLVLLSGMIIIFLFACRNPFAPALTNEGKSNKLLTRQETPDSTLKNFRFAYTFKDSLVYSEVLDSTFIFRSMDFNQSPPKPIEWGRDTELRTTARMFRFFNTLDVVWNTISAPDTVQYSPFLIIEHKVTFTLTLDGGRTIPPLNGEVIFQFTQRKKKDNGKTVDKYYISLWIDQKI